MIQMAEDTQDINLDDGTIQPQLENRDVDFVVRKFPMLGGSFVLHVVLSMSFLSFLMGLNIASLNTALPTITSQFNLCGPGLFEKSLTLKECEQSSRCMDECKIQTTADGIKIKKCPGGYNDIDCSVSKWYNAFLSSAVLIGGAFGAITGGNFMYMGRRKVTLGTLLLYILGVVLSASANEYSSLLVGRLIVGYAVGLTSVVAPTYMSEMTPAQLRGTYGVLHQLMITLGILVASLLGLPLESPDEKGDDWVPSNFQKAWWRVMLSFGAIPVFLLGGILLLVFKFETPIYYIERDQKHRAEKMLKMIYSKDNVEKELSISVESVRQSEESKKNGLTIWKTLQDPYYRYIVMVASLLSAFQQLGGINVFMTSSTQFFRDAGLNGIMQKLATCAMALINVLMTFPTLYLIEQVGRKKLLLFGSLGQAVFLLPASVCHIIDPRKSSKPELYTQITSIIAILGFVISFAIAYGPVLWVYLFEVFPMEIKDTAAGMATAVNWFSGVLIVIVSLVIPLYVAYPLFFGLQLVATLIIQFMVKESQGCNIGKSPYEQT